MSRKDKIIVLLFTMLVGFSFPAIGASLDVTLPKMADVLLLSVNSYSSILLVGSLVAIVFYLLIGKISDAFGKKRSLVLGIFILLLAAIFFGTAFNSVSLILASIGLSVGGAIMYVNGLALGCSLLKEGGVGKFIGLFSFAIYLGRVVGPVLAGTIMEHSSWRYVFYFYALIVFIVLLLALYVGKLEHEEVLVKWEKGFDFKGLIIFGIGVGLTVFSLTKIGENVGYAFGILVGLIMLFLFWKAEEKTKNPLLPLNIFHNNKPIVYGLAINALCYVGTYGIAALNSLYFQNALGVSATVTGVLLAIIPFCQMLFAPVAGRLSDKYGNGKIGLWGIIGVGLALISLYIGTMNEIVVLVVIGMILLGLSYVHVIVPNTQLVMVSVPEENMGAGSSLVGLFRNIGETFSSAVVNFALIMVLGQMVVAHSSVAQLTEVYNKVMVIYFIAIAVTLVLSIKRNKLK